MLEVSIAHNPYNLTTMIEVNGESPKADSSLQQCMEGRFQLWVDVLLARLSEEYNCNEIEIVFRGTDLDYQDLQAAAEAADEDGVTCIVKRSDIPIKNLEEKERDLRELISSAQRLPYEELQSDEVEDAIDKAFNEEFDVNVVATMSAGKSTLINALLCQKLMPSKQAACTATVTRIRDVDGASSFSASALDTNQNELAQYTNLDYDTMRTLNNDENVCEILVEGNIPFVDSNAVSLVLIDTPGTDNARDKRHREVTEKALDKSSKMLVLFVMNGGKLHDEAQDRLLRRIADTMKVGGKQSRERFMFVINKMDTYDEEDDDIAGETIPDTKTYLQEMGIENPNIFPASAELALEIRRLQSATDPDERRKFENKLTPIANKMIEQEQLHLETYPQLSSESKDVIEKELQTAVDNDDLFGQALVHTGIRGIEETIRMYITKYCQPAKIKNVYDNFSKALESAGAFEKTKADIAAQSDHLQEIGAQMDALSAKLASQEENEAFKEKLQALDISSEVEKQIRKQAAPIEGELTALFSNRASEMDKDEAEAMIQNIQKTADETEAQFINSVNQLLEGNIREMGRKLVEEYVRKINALSDEFSMDSLSINLNDYVGSALHTLESGPVIEQALETEENTHQENRVRIAVRERKKWNPFRVFRGNYFTVKEKYTVDVEETRTFVSLEKLRNIIVPPIRESFYQESERACQFARKQAELIKDDFSKAFDQVDQILKEKSNELNNVTKSKEAAETALAQSRERLSELDALQRKLDEILEI